MKKQKSITVSGWHAHANSMLLLHSTIVLKVAKEVLFQKGKYQTAFIRNFVNEGEISAASDVNRLKLITIV